MRRRYVARAMKTVLLVGAGGFFGAAARYLVATATHAVLGARFPYGTLMVNVTGSIFLGLFLAVGEGHLGLIPPAARAVVAIGFVGAFTTFSTFSYESVQLLANGSGWLALGNIAANLLLCLAGTAAGIAVGRMG